MTDKPRKYRPLSLDVSLVPAVLEGRKTMTRRPINPQPEFTEAHLEGLCRLRPGVPVSAIVTDAWQSGFVKVDCPLGAPGDGLWLRERARVLRYELAYEPPMARLRYEADGAEQLVDWPERLRHVEPGRCIPNGVHREGSRWSGLITGGRVERVQDITEEDARAEGVEPCGGFMASAGCWTNYGSNGPSCRTARESFGTLWDCHYPGSWERNEWVWVVQWKRVE